ncbi:hypothetical protein [Prosthecobacter sp.]|uniref:hypothetical protein n=1 Tax=Prosthecobacter sp. TaxID=1965333 RepID=UPI00378376FB
MPLLLGSLSAGMPAEVAPVAAAADNDDATAVAAAEPVVMEHFLPEDELKALLREFAAHAEKLDRRLTEAEEARNFERFYEVMVKALMNVGTFSEGGADDEADFASWRGAEPARILRVKARVEISLKVARAVLAACGALGSEHAVVFDGPTGRCVVFSNGDWCRED